MGPPDGPSGSKELEWADVILNELNSWDPSRLSTRFHPRSHHGPAGVWRPLPLALAVLLVALLAATALAGGPRGLTMVIANLATGRPQPSATPSTDHAGGAVHTSPGSAAAVTSGSAATPLPSQQNASQPGSSGAPAGQGQAQGGGVPSSTGGSQTLPPQVQLPVPDQSPPSRLPPLPTPAFPRLPPVPVMPPGPGGGAPTPPGGVGGHPPTPGLPINHPMPAPTSGAR